MPRFINLRKYAGHTLRLLLSAALVWNLAACAAQAPEQTGNSTDTRTEASTQENPFAAVPGDGEIVAFAYAFGLESPKYTDTMVYDGTPLQVTYYINSDGAAMSVGVLMFVNGVPQPYSVDGGETDSYMYIQPVEADAYVAVQAQFVPVCGSAGETVSIRFLCILNPQLRPDALNYIYGHTNSMTTFHSRDIIMEVDAPEQASGYSELEMPREMTQEEIDQVIYTDGSGNSVNKLDWFHFVARNAEDSSLVSLPVENHCIRFQLQGYGGSDAAYMVIPYINQVPVLSDSYPCLLNMKSGTYIFSQLMALDLSELDPDVYQLQSYNTLYLLAIPLNGGGALQPVITQSFVFCWEDAE